MKILIIEDDDSCMESLSFAFSVYWPGAEIIPAYRGYDGLKLAEACKPDLILLDLGLPDISGIKVLQKLQASGSAPVMLLTAQSEATVVGLSVDMGAVEYVSKPFHPRKLINRLQHMAFS